MYFAATGGCETVCKYLLEQKCVVFDIASVVWMETDFERCHSFLIVIDCLKRME